jgi:CRISPR/Cas system-associated exonuclease Cas4 (RecB family)
MPLASIADLNRPLEEIAPFIDQAKELSSIYDDFVVLEQDGQDRLPGIHASELYPCLRKPVYSLMGTPRRPNVSKFWKQRFKMGTAIHQMLQADFHAVAKRSKKGLAMRVAQAQAEKMDCYVEFEDELKVAPELQAIAKYYQLQSHADGVFTFKRKTDDTVVLRVGLEIKSEAPDGYSKLTEPKSEHVRQGHIYMACLDLPLMWFLYMNKGNQNNTPSTAPWLVTWQPRVWAELEDRFKVIHEYAAKGSLPERTETIMCEFCPWAYDCQPQNMMKNFQKPSNRRETIRGPGK